MPPNAAVALQIDRSELLVGRYRPIRPLGAGGSGQVWLALDEDTGREVALKIVPRQGRAEQRAEREAEAVSRLRHPVCARSLTLAEDSEHVYLVYGYIPGRTLREALRSRELTDTQVIEIAAQLLEGLDHAHGEGIVHRDVKPTNVILEDGPGLRIRLVDFGLALIDDADPLTAEGDVPGTLAYISPERLDGTDATEAADVWSVGLVIWEGLCGRHPFFGEPATRTTERIMAGPGSLADERPELPPAVIETVDAALALDPAERPSPSALATRLREIANGRRRRRAQPRRRARLDRREAAGRALHAVLSSSFAAAMLILFPFLPQTFTLPVALLVAAAAFLRPRVGLALALAVPILPLGDISTGLAIAYAGAAACWFQLHWRQPRAGMAFMLGPLFAAVGLLALVAFSSIRIVGALQRALSVLAAVAAAVGFASIQGRALPFVDTPPPAGLGITGSDSPTAVVEALARYAASQPTLLVITGILALIAVLAPLARRATLWQLSLASSTIVAAALLGPTLAFGTDVAPGQIVVAVAIGIALVARPALAALRQATPNPVAAAAASMGGRLTRAIPRPAIKLRRRGRGSVDEAEALANANQIARAPAELGPIVTDPISLEEVWSNLIDAGH